MVRSLGRTLGRGVFQLLRCKDQVNRCCVVISSVPCFGSPWKKAAKSELIHQVDDRICFALSLCRHIVSAPKLVVSVEVSYHRHLHHCIRFRSHFVDGLSQVVPCVPQCLGVVPWHVYGGHQN